MKKKKKEYQRPAAQVVELVQKLNLLTSSPTGNLPNEETPETAVWN